MSTIVFLAVILAALLHATWNGLVKGGKDKDLAMVAVVLGHVPFALLMLPFAPTVDLACWPYLIGSVALHMGYQLLLLNSYRFGDLTQVYPIARGSAPLIVAVVSVTMLGVVLAPLEIAAVTVIGIGIMSLALVRKEAGLANRRAGLLALATGCFIAGYSLNDGMGARVAGTAIGFYALATMGNATLMVLYAAVARPGLLRRVPTEGLTMFLVGGGASYLAYALVMWAFTQAPIALVTALRETSIVFALLIGVFVLKEKLDLAKLFSTATILVGALLLRIGRA